MPEPRPYDKSLSMGGRTPGWHPADDYNAMVVRTPRRMVEIQDQDGNSFTTSTLDGYTDCCELYDIDQYSARTSDDRSSNHLYSSSTLYHSHVRIIIPVGRYATNIELSMNNGDVLKQIIVYYLATVRSGSEDVQVIEYNTCQIQYYKQTTDSDGRDILIVEFRFITKTTTIKHLGQDGNNKGQSISTVDYSTSVTDAGGDSGGGDDGG